MNATEIAAWIGAAAGLGGVGTTFGMLFKAKSESRKTNADADKSKADAVKVIQDASAGWVQSVSEELRELRREVAALRRERDHDHRRLRIHERWDIDMAHQVRQLGGHVTDPPPLYPDPTAA